MTVLCECPVIVPIVAISYSYLYANSTRKNLVDLGPTKAFLDTHLYEPNKWKDGTDKNKEKKNTVIIPSEVHKVTRTPEKVNYDDHSEEAKQFLNKEDIEHYLDSVDDELSEFREGR